MLTTLKKFTLGSLLAVTAYSHAATDIIEGNLRTYNFDTDSDTISGHFGAVSNQTSEQIGNVPGNRYFGDFEFDFQKNINTLKKGRPEMRFHAAALVNDQNLAMYSLEEVYIGTKLSSMDYVYFGRRILPWSAVDSVWGFGKLNNRRNFDYFTPGQEGLIGLLYEARPSTGFRLRAFASPLYVPEMNPALDIDKKNQTITTRHPWGDAPASRANVDGVMMDVKYDVDFPEPQEVIFRYSAGLNMGFENKHWVWDNFIMRKPENGTTPDVEVNVDFEHNVVNAQIDPRFYYHDVYGSTLKYRNRDIEMYVSGMAVRPNEYPDVDEKVRYTEIKNRKRREDYVGGGISRSNDLYVLAFNYVARLSPFDRLKDDLAQDPRWNQALNFFALRNFGRKFSLAGDVKYDMLTTDRLVMVRGSYHVTKDFQMNVGINMIGTPTNGKSYWSPYTNNDAVYGGLRYVF